MLIAECQRKGVGRTQPFMDGDAAGICGRHQRTARIVAIGFHRVGNAGDHTANSVQRQRVDDRMDGVGQKPLNAMGQRVDAGRRNQPGGQSARQIGIAQRHARHQERAARAQGGLAGFEMHAGHGRAFAARAKRRGHRDQRGDITRHQRGVGNQVRRFFEAGRNERGQQLGRVEHRSAAQRDDAVATVLTKCSRGLFDSGGSGVFRNVQELRGDGWCCLHHAGHDACRFQPAIADQQRTRDPQHGQFIGQQSQLSRAKDQSGQGECGAHETILFPVP